MVLGVPIFKHFRVVYMMNGFLPSLPVRFWFLWTLSRKHSYMDSLFIKPFFVDSCQSRKQEIADSLGRKPFFVDSSWLVVLGLTVL